jgi:hypothetical protein
MGNTNSAAQWLPHAESGCSIVRELLQGGREATFAAAPLNV